MHGPVSRDSTALRRTLGSKGPTFAGILAYDMKCPDCGYHECGCGLLAQRAEEAADREWFMQQEAQRAELARDPHDISKWPRIFAQPVQNHLRHGDPRRMSLGYNERDYDESRRVAVKSMRAELEGMKADLLAGRCASTELSSARICLLGVAIAEHERKLPSYNFPVQVLAEHGHYGRNNPDSEGFFLNLEANAGKEIRVGSALQKYFEDQAKLLARDRPELAVQLQNYGYLK
jgi:hypothetical protein